MRCPRCSFEGELIDGACAQCGYQRVSGSENIPSTNTPSSRSLSIQLGSQTGPLRPPSMPPRTPTDPLRSPSMPLRTPTDSLRPPSMPQRKPTDSLRSPSVPLRAQTGPLRSPSMPLHLSTDQFGSPSMPMRAIAGPSRGISLSTAKSGDLLHQGRYRLVDQVLLPDNQQGQGVAWLALDTMSGSIQVVIREVLMPGQDQESKAHAVRTAAIRLSETQQHPGFAKVLDVFNEQSNYFIVFQHIEGESLASLLRRQGGALPERTVAEYGRQLCEMLIVLSRQQPPLTHGAISPETVIVSPDRNRVHLVHLPLFPPKEAPNAASVASYKAPEQARSMADAASDLYSVAATMHHAVTGFDPRERIAFFYPPARRLNPTVSQQMETILAQELRLSAPQRYARAVDMQKDLVSLLASKLPEVEMKPVSAPAESLKQDLLQMRKRSRQRSRVQLGIFGAISLLILGGVLFYSYIYPALTSMSNASSTPTPNVTATTSALTDALNAEWQTETALYNTKQLGISDGRYAFDIYDGRPSLDSLNYKKLAAQALFSNNISTALNDYQEAVTLDKTDAEAQIYYEDLRVSAQNVPYVTIVLGLPLDNSPADLAISRPAMLAAYEFQNRVNQLANNNLPNGFKLRILIGNSGADNGDVATIAQYIAKRVQIGNLDHIIAVVGWPTSGEATNASPALTAAKIPLITQTASSTSLDGISQFFFRTNPNDSVQGNTSGNYAYNVLKAKRVLVLRDPSDTYSQSLADAFTKSFTSLGGSVVPDNPNDNFKEHTTTVDQYAQGALHDIVAAKNHVDLIFLAGYDDDAVRLAHALGQAINANPFSLSKLKILGGATFDTGLVLGNGVGPDAQMAHDNPQDMQRLIFTSFANSAQWGSMEPVFIQNWQKIYGVGSNAPQPDNTAIMTSDAFGVIGYSMQWVTGSLTGDSLRVALSSIGKETTPAFQGWSGAISFDNNGNPVNKTALLMTVGVDSSTGALTLQPLNLNS